MFFLCPLIVYFCPFYGVTPNGAERQHALTHRPNSGTCPTPRETASQPHSGTARPPPSWVCCRIRTTVRSARPTSWIVRSTVPSVDRSFREMPLELLEDRGGAGLRFGILLPHGSDQEASQSLPLLLRQMGAQDPAGPGQQGVRVGGNRAYGGLTHRRGFYRGPSCRGQPPPGPPCGRPDELE